MQTQSPFGQQNTMAQNRETRSPQRHTTGRNNRQRSNQNKMKR